MIFNIEFDTDTLNLGELTKIVRLIKHPAVLDLILQIDINSMDIGIDHSGNIASATTFYDAIINNKNCSPEILQKILLKLQGDRKMMYYVSYWIIHNEKVSTYTLEWLISNSKNEATIYEAKRVLNSCLE